MASEQEIERIVVRVMGDVGGALNAFKQVQTGVKDMGTGTARGVDEILKEMDRLNQEIAKAQAGGNKTKLGSLVGERDQLRGEAAAVSAAIQAKKDAEAKVADDIAEMTARQNDIRWAKEIESERKYLRMKEDMEEAADQKAHEARLKQREKEYQLQQKQLDAQINSTIKEIEADNKKKADEEQRVKDRFSGHRINENLSEFKQAEQVKQSLKTETSRKFDELNRLDKLRDKGLLSEQEHKLATSKLGEKALGPLGRLEAVFEDFNRRAVNRFSGGIEAGMGGIEAMAHHVREGTEVSLKQTMGTINQTVSGVVGGFAPVAGAVLGGIGSLVTSFVGLIEDALMSTTRKARKLRDDVVSGGITAQQALLSASTQSTEQSARRAATVYEGRFINARTGQALSGDDPAVREWIRRDAASRTRVMEDELNSPRNRTTMRMTDVVRAQGQTAVDTTTLEQTAAREGMVATEADRMARAQRLAVQAGISLREAQQELAPVLDRLTAAQQRANSAAARDQIMQTTRNYLAQGAAIGQTSFEAEDAARRYGSIQQLARQSGISMAQAMRELTPSLNLQSASAASVAYIQWTGSIRGAAQAMRDARVTFLDFSQTVEGSRDQYTNVDTTTQESIGRQQQMRVAEEEGARAEANRQRTLAATQSDVNSRGAALSELRDRVIAAREQAAAMGANLPAQFVAQNAALEAQFAAMSQQQAVGLQVLATQRQQNQAANQQAQAARDLAAAEDRRLRQLELQRQAMSQGYQLMVQMRSPLENYEISLYRIENLRARGAIDPLTRQRSIAAEADRLEGAAGGPDQRMVSGMTFGSAAAVSAINRYRNAQEDRQESPAERLLRIQQQALQMQTDQARVGRLLLDAMQAQQQNLAAGRVVAMLGLALR